MFVLIYENFSPYRICVSTSNGQRNYSFKTRLSGHRVRVSQGTHYDPRPLRDEVQYVEANCRPLRRYKRERCKPRLYRQQSVIKQEKKKRGVHLVRLVSFISFHTPKKKLKFTTFDQGVDVHVSMRYFVLDLLLYF